MPLDSDHVGISCLSFESLYLCWFPRPIHQSGKSPSILGLFRLTISQGPFSFYPQILQFSHSSIQKKYNQVMSALQKHVYRNDPQRAARLATLARKQGYVDDDGGLTLLGGLGTVSDGRISQRPALAEQARIPPTHRFSRSASPALSATSNGWHGRDDSMPPPLRPRSGLGFEAPSLGEVDNYEDMFGTDVENADATTTISNMSVEEMGSTRPQNLERRGVKSSDLYHQDELNYEESIFDDKQHFEPRHFSAGNGDDQIVEEGYTEEEESQAQASDEEHSQYDQVIEPDTVRERILEKHPEGAFINTRMTPSSKQRIIQSLVDSPSTKRTMKNMTIRGKEPKASQEKRNLSPEPLNFEGQRMPVRDHFRDMQQTKSHDPAKPVETAIRDGFHHDDKVPRNQDYQFKTIAERPFNDENEKQPGQHTADKITSTEQPLAADFARYKQQSVDGVAPHAEKTSAPEESTAYESPEAHPVRETNGDTPNGIANSNEHRHLDSSAPVDTGPHLGGKITAVENGTQTDDASAPETSQSAAEPTTKSLATKPEPRKRALELDYTPQEMSGMSYKHLKSESFDHNPSISPGTIPSDFAKGSLPAKLQYAYDLKDRDNPEVQRSTLFASLTIEQYEETGDLIIDQFSNILGRYKGARKARREAARGFEKEIAQREERVQSKSNAVEQDLIRLRRGAEDVVRGPRRGS